MQDETETGEFATLLVAPTQKEADEMLKSLAVERPVMTIGIGGSLYGNRFKKIIFKGPISVDAKVFDWLRMELICRLRHDGSVRVI